MIYESLNDLSKRLKLISDIRQQVNLIHNLYENKRILGKSNFKKVHTVNKGESSRGFITLGKGMEYIPPVDSLKSAHSIRRRASSIIQDYDSRLLPDVIRKPFNFFPHNKYDFVGKRQEFVKTAAGQSTAIVPYTPSFTDELASKYGMHGPQVPNPNDRYAEQQKKRRENKYRYARLQASRRRDERERLYAKAPWMKSLVQSGIIDKKFIPKIAKGVDKLSTLKNTNVRRAVAAVSVVDGAIRYYNKYRKAHLDAKAEDQSIRDSAIFGGNAAYSKLGFGLGMNETDSIKSFQRLQAKFGPATMEVLKAYGESMKDAPGWVRQNLAGEWGLSADDANIAMFLGGEKEFTMAHAHKAADVAKAKYLRDMRKKGWFGARFADIVEDAPIISPMFDLMKQTDGELKAIQDRANKVIDSQYEASLPPPIPSNTNIGGDNNVSSNINTPISITVYGNADPQEIASVTAESVNRVISRRSNIDNISPGVLA